MALAASGAEGLALARRVRPSVVVLDVGLPDQSGREVCKRIRADARHAGTALLMLTSAGLRGDAERRTFLSGVMLGFSEKLDQEAKVQQQQGLIWRGDAELGSYLRQRHPHIRRVAQRGQPRTETRAEGRRAGRNIILHRPITSGSSSGGGPRLLPPRRGGA